MRTFVSQLDMALYPVPQGETLSEMAPPLSVEDLITLSVAVLVPCIALSTIGLSGSLLAAPALAAEAFIIPTTAVFAPALGIFAVVLAVAACCLGLLDGFYRK
ncbi:hypothetical protein DFH06DRAFT_430048 [Mycena polygramma]|nr:hypothetical protein DFH06DRAFT_430048 [Mycena polygramma]